MTYGMFLALFLGLPLLLGLVIFRQLLTRGLVLTLGAIAVAAVIYTGPWDNLIIVNGVWSYGPGRILGPLIGHVPLEEYGFYVLQVFLTGILTAVLLRREIG